MIQITVKLKNDYDLIYKDITITKEELMQFACNKARGMYMEGYYTHISAEYEINIEGAL